LLGRTSITTRPKKKGRIKEGPLRRGQSFLQKGGFFRGGEKGEERKDDRKVMVRIQEMEYSKKGKSQLHHEGRGSRRRHHRIAEGTQKAEEKGRLDGSPSLPKERSLSARKKNI